MSLISVQNLSISFGEKSVFENISFQVEEREKVGFVGVNGAGKTTLFKIITGDYTDYTGNCFLGKNVRIGYMEQHACSDSGVSVYEELLNVFENLIAMEEEIEEISLNIENGVGDLKELIARQSFLNDEFNRLGGLTYKSRTRSALMGLGFSEDAFSMPTHKLSGGQRSKLVLAKLLLSECDFLLLDEPTNHLDIDSIEWLEGFLRDFRGAVLIVSHDRFFLDKITGKTMELRDGKITVYSGNYSQFLEKKEKLQQDIEEKYEEDLKEIGRIEAIVAQQRQWNREKNIKTAESKLKQIERIKAQMVLPERHLEKIKFNFTPKCISSNDVLFCSELEKSFGDKKIFSNISFEIHRGEKVFLLGPNGCGKTTLFKIIMNDFSADFGKVTFGQSVQTGYFDQVQEKLDRSKTAIEEIWTQFPYMTQTQIRNALAVFLFKGDDVFKKIEMLSGGERARIALLKLMLGGFNFLLLDEPTNHLDTFSREELENTLKEYEGTMIIVSHDRYFINKLADRILYMTQDGIQEYIGGYDAFLEKYEPVGKIQKSAAAEKPPASDYKLRKEIQSSIRKAKTKISRLEEEIAVTEEEIAACEISLTEESVSSDYDALLERTERLHALKCKIESLYESWEEEQVNLQDLLKFQ